jgi:acetate kinase
VTGVDPAEDVSCSLTAQDHAAAVKALTGWVEPRTGREPLTAVGHRVVHAGPNYSSPNA